MTGRHWWYGYWKKNRALNETETKLHLTAMGCHLQYGIICYRKTNSEKLNLVLSYYCVQQRIEAYEPTKISQFLLDCVTSYAQRISEYDMPPMMKKIIRGPLLALV